MMINQGMWNDNPFDSWTEEEEHLSKMGVVSFGKGGGGGGQPAHTTQQTTSQYPDELKPFIQDIFGKAKGIEDQRSAAGYQAYDAPRIAGFNQDQQDAFTGIREAQGASTPYFEAQETLIDRSTAGPSAQRTAQYMNPYTQNVIDIQQRELGRQGEQERQKIGAGAVGAGGFGGSRQAILEAEQMRNQGMRGDDIQAKGMNQAYAQAQQAMSQADARGLQGAGMYGQMGTQVPAQRMKELGALAGVGAADQTQQQRALDLGYRQFQDEYNYPMKTLNDYSAILRGFPLPANTSMNQTAYSAVAPLSSQLLGAGAGLTGIAGMAGLFGASGGQVKKLQQGGLASMYAPPSNRVRMGKTNYDGSFFFDEDFQEDSIGATPEQIQERTDRNRWYADIIAGGTEAADANRARLAERAKAASQKESTDLLDAMAEAEESNIADQKWLENKYDLDDKEYDKAKEDYDKVIEDAKKERETEDTARERRIRMAKWAPLMQKARSIAEAETLGGAILGGIEGAGDVLMGEAAGEAAEVTRAAGLRAAAIDEAVQLAGVQKDLSRDDLRIELLKAYDTAARFSDTELMEKYSNAINAIDNAKVDLTGNIRSLIANKNLSDILSGSGEALSFEEALAAQTQKEGGPVKLAKGGTPERSFDFVPKDGKLIAVPK